ncbi:MAG: hypothetical protein RL094_621 [Candidatus Parcubacteria bacterium]|jgi:hypothetical protein
MKYQYKLWGLLLFMAVCVAIVIGYIYTQYSFSMPGKITDTFYSDSVLKRGGVRVAFFGDQGLTSQSKDVLRLVKNEGAELLVHLGDIDYADNPDAWVEQYAAILGSSTDYLTVLGNHELKKWDEYKKKIEEQITSAKYLKCTGENGVESTCTYKDITFVLTTPNLTEKDHVGYIKSQLAISTSTWNVCAWHENMRAMQLGDKKDEVGWGVYEECRKAGAIVATAHEHSYSRTKLLSSFKNKTVATSSNVLQLEKGKSFAFVSGLGGQSVRPQKLNGPWWATVYTSTQKALPGALFCTFGTNGDKNRAECYFKDIKGRIADQFVVNAVGAKSATSTN